jgi:hypothetical protein
MKNNPDKSADQLQIELNVLQKAFNSLKASYERDFLEHLNAQKILNESEEKYRMLFDTLTEGVALNEIVYDENHEMVEFNVTIPLTEITYPKTEKTSSYRHITKPIKRALLNQIMDKYINKQGNENQSQK